MAGYNNLPELKSAKLMHIDELANWKGDEIHGNSVRVLGRVCGIDAVNDLIHIEYHGSRLNVCSKLLSGGPLPFSIGSFFQFLGQLERTNDGKMVLKARLFHDMKGIDTNMYDRCLRIRRDFEEKLLKDETSASHQC